MIKLRPFWSNDILKTEKWLNKMSNKGLGLKKVNFLLGIFEFEKEDVSDKKYRIVYDKRFRGTVQEIPLNILESGYQVVHSARKFYVMSFIGQPDTNPSYSMFLERNQKRAFVTGIIALVIGMFLIPGILISSIFFIFPSDYVEVTYFWYGYAGDIIIPIIFLFCFFTWLKLYNSNKQLEKISGEKIKFKFTSPDNILKPKQEILELKKQKKIFRKFKFGWVYAPDKVEKWLEEMETKGYQLYRISNLGNFFYFIKGEPRKMKYVVDNQKCTLPEYFKINKDAGWKLIFRSMTNTWSYIVWSHEIEENELVFMCDEEENLKRSRRLFLLIGVFYIPGIILYCYWIMDLFLYWINASRTLDLMNGVVFFTFFFSLFIFTYITVKSAGYYFRMRKIYKSIGSIRI